LSSLAPEWCEAFRKLPERDGVGQWASPSIGDPRDPGGRRGEWSRMLALLSYDQVGTEGLDDLQ
jgi:hypothetical protein